MLAKSEGESLDDRNGDCSFFDMGRGAREWEPFIFWNGPFCDAFRLTVNDARA